MIPLPFGAKDALDQAYRMTLEALEAAGHPVYEPALLNGKLHSRRFGRLLMVMEEPATIVYVARSPWTEEVAPLVVTDLVNAYRAGKEMGPPPGFAFLSAYPVLEVVDRMFDGSLVSRIEVDARSAVPLRTPLPPETAPVLAKTVAMPMLKELTGKAWRADLKTLPAIQAVVLDRFRKGTDHETALPEGAWMPEAALLALGALVGEALAAAPGLEAAWINHDSFPLSLALALRNPATGKQAVWNPVGKVMKLYLYGLSDDLTWFAKVALDKMKEGAGR